MLLIENAGPLLPKLTVLQRKLKSKLFHVQFTNSGQWRCQHWCSPDSSGLPQHRPTGRILPDPALMWDHVLAPQGLPGSHWHSRPLKGSSRWHRKQLCQPGYLQWAEQPKTHNGHETQGEKHWHSSKSLVFWECLLPQHNLSCLEW